MPWFRVDDQLDANKKVKSIPRRMRAKAMGLWVQAGAFCSRELTDGFVPRYMLEDFAVTPAVAQALVDAGMWKKVSDGWNFVEWDEYNPSSTEVRLKRDAARKRQAEFRERKKAERENASASNNKILSQCDTRVTNSVTNAVTNAPVTAPRPDPTRPDPLLNTGSREGIGSTAREDNTPLENETDDHDQVRALIAGASADAERREATTPEEALDNLAAQTANQRAPYPDHCHTHAHIADPGPCRACRDTRLANTAHQDELARKRTEARREAIADCPLCDDNGMRTITEEGRPLAVRCTHPATTHGYGGQTIAEHPNDNDLPPWEQHA